VLIYPGTQLIQPQVPVQITQRVEAIVAPTICEDGLLELNKLVFVPVKIIRLALKHHVIKKLFYLSSVGPWLKLQTLD
jgi:hypothetical protein